MDPFLAMRLINCYLFSILFLCCQPKNPSEPGASKNTDDLVASQSTATSQGRTSLIGKNIMCMLQDKNGHYWFGTDDGAYRYDGKTLKRFTEQDGMFQNQVQFIQEDAFGNIWFTNGGYGVTRFDGRNMQIMTNFGKIQTAPPTVKAWKTRQSDLYFFAGGGVYRYDGNLFEYLPFPKADFDQHAARYAANQGSRYGVYAILKDRSGAIWCGTQAMGVCRFDGNSFTWLTEKGLRGPAVLALYQDKNGDVWFGNNGSGLFRYDGKKLRNITEEEGLGNPEFRTSGKSGPGSMARISAIGEDDSENLWVGTFDAGVWKYDGHDWIQYTTRDGLPGLSVTAFYQDHTGNSWFGTMDGTVCTFDGASFHTYTFNIAQ